jgi:hypothetical protein
VSSSAGQPRQGDLFATAALGPAAAPLPPPLLRSQLLAWQARLAAHQAPLFQRRRDAPAQLDQGQLLDPLMDPSLDPLGDPSPQLAAAWRLDPLGLEAQSLSFWRWPSAPQQGAAIYLVLDRPAQLPDPLLLYVGETGRADRRWKGDHDCKSYLAAYSESLGKVDLAARLSIRFWCDGPSDLRQRRQLEQALIRLWLPPFNKETRGRWATPFTADLA